MAGVTVDERLAELCRAQHARIVGMLALYVGDRAVAEELAQETFVRLHQHWARVRTMTSPEAWLTTVGLNLARSWWRRHFAQRRAQQRLEAEARHVSAGADSADVLAVRAAVAALPPRQRAALVLRYYAGLSVAETARELRCAQGTVKSLTHKAVAALRTSFDVAEIEIAPVPEEVGRA